MNDKWENSNSNQKSKSKINHLERKTTFLIILESKKKKNLLQAHISKQIEWNQRYSKENNYSIKCLEKNTKENKRKQIYFAKITKRDK